MADRICKQCGAPLSARNDAGECDHGAETGPKSVPAAAPELPAQPLSVVPPAAAIPSVVGAPAGEDPKAIVKDALLKTGYSEEEAEEMASSAIEKLEQKKS